MVEAVALCHMAQEDCGPSLAQKMHIRHKLLLLPTHAFIIHVLSRTSSIVCYALLQRCA